MINKLMKKFTYLIEFLFLSFHRASHYFRSFLYNFHYVPATAPLITATFFYKEASSLLYRLENFPGNFIISYCSLLGRL